jgi:uncharacterized membrane protein/uncharacterized protein YacL (UPF0231 family)
MTNKVRIGNWTGCAKRLFPVILFAVGGLAIVGVAGGAVPLDVDGSGSTDALATNGSRLGVAGQQAGELQVTVTDETGTPVGGATVVLYDGDWEPVATQETGDGGNYTWSDLEAGRYFVEAYQQDEYWGAIRTRVTAGDRTTEAIDRRQPYVETVDVAPNKSEDEVFVGDSVSVIVEIRNDAKFPQDVQLLGGIPEAEFATRPGPRTIASNESATFELTFTPEEPGRHCLSTGVESDVADNAVRPQLTDSRKTCFEVLPEPGNIDVTVTDENGTSVGGAAVVLYDADYQPLDNRSADSDGSVRWEDIQQGTYILEVYGDGDEFWRSAEVEVAAGETTEITLERRRPYVENVTVAVDDEKIVTGDNVSVVVEIRNDAEFPQDVKLVGSSPDGDLSAETEPQTVGGSDSATFEFTVTPAEAGTYCFNVAVQSRINDDWVRTDVRQEVACVDVIPPIGDLDVTVTDENGTSVGGAAVVLYDADYQPLDNRSADSDGSVLWEGLDRGTYFLEVYGDGDEFWRSAEVEVAAGETTETTLERRRPYVTAVDVAADEIFAGDNVSVAVTVRNDAPFAQDTRITGAVNGTDVVVEAGPETIDGGTSATYELTFTPDEPGTYCLAVDVESDVNDDWVRTDSREEATCIDVAPAIGDLQVSVADETGSAAGGATVVLYDGDYQQLETRSTDSDGSVTWEDLDRGTYILEVYGDGDEFWRSAEVEVAAGETTETTLERRRPYVASADIDAEAVQIGQEASLSIEVRNDAGFAHDVRVGVSAGDATVAQQGPVTVAADGSETVTVPFVPEQAGSYCLDVAVESNVNDNWVLTDARQEVACVDVQSATVRGTVSHADMDRTVDGATVYLNGEQVATTGDDGSYQFEVGALGTHTVTVDKEGFEPVEREVTIDETTGGEARVDVALPAEPQTVQFEVSKKSTIEGYEFGGEPIEGATVTVAGQTKTTDSDGLATFELPGGRHTFTVQADGYETLEDTVTVFSGKGSKLVSVPLVRTGVGVLELTVLDADGNTVPLSAYEVRVDGEVMEPNQQGELLLDAGERVITIVPSDEGLQSVERTVTVQEGRRVSVEITLERETTQEGRADRWKQTRRVPPPTRPATVGGVLVTG